MGLDRFSKWVLGGRTAAPERLRLCKILRNSAVTENASPNGLILSLPLATHGTGLAGFAARLAKAPLNRTYELEEVGAFVWSCCDGKQSFDSISKKLASTFKMGRLESEVALSEFVKMLARRGLVIVVESSREKGRR